MNALKRKRAPAINVILAMYVVDAVTTVAALRRHEPFVGVNVIGILFDLVVIVSLWSMYRWGAAFTIVASGKGIGQSFIILQLAFLGGAGGTPETAFWSWGEPLVVISTDIFIIIYLFHAIFRGDFNRVTNSPSKST